MAILRKVRALITPATRVANYALSLKMAISCLYYRATAVQNDASSGPDAVSFL